MVANVRHTVQAVQEPMDTCNESSNGMFLGCSKSRYGLMMVLVFSKGEALLARSDLRDRCFLILVPLT